MGGGRWGRGIPVAAAGGRAALTLVLASAATATALAGTGRAEPRLSPAQARAEADKLFREAEEATERYNGAREKAAAAKEAVDALRDEAARRTATLNTARDALGSMAAAEYRAGTGGGLPPALRLALTADPDAYLDGAVLAARAAGHQARTVGVVRGQLVELDRLRTEAAGRLTELESLRAEAGRHKAAMRTKAAAARKLVQSLPPTQQAAYQDGTASAEHPGPPPSDGARAADGSRAAAAIAFAYGALGKPYVWGATGPSAFDCSGLTQAAWGSAGVALPRTTYTQIGAGRRVGRGELAPGDLVFFYPGVSHVGLYIGGGRMIHAPRPGAPVRIAPIDEMPWAGATRVA
ncbi:C40 family peptidase [Streptomyces sp. ODS05-4]|uniref:C40 family peptidase n=1 Tax=Streptomyces sp. ODS05-4 TaxID=2944939 RepID=UPI00210D1494|nr:C40 family peptidase [Streptomyces sp. ODS05-4]